MPPEDRVRGRIHEWFGDLANGVSHAVGSPWGFGLALLAVGGWALSGPAFGFSDHWQLIINTGTTIVTFLIVFLIQHAQNKDARAIQIKLNELLAAVEGASNRLINVEKLSDRELDRLQAQFQALAQHIRARRCRARPQRRGRERLTERRASCHREASRARSASGSTRRS
jgi:low affinity Fe/Cu permease